MRLNHKNAIIKMDEPEKNSFPSPLGVAILLAAFAFGFSFYELRLWVGDFRGLRYYGCCPQVPLHPAM